MSDFLTYLSNLFTLTFVVSSMFFLGLRLTVRQIIELLRSPRQVLSALLANFVGAPAANPAAFVHFPSRIAAVSPNFRAIRTVAPIQQPGLRMREGFAHLITSESLPITIFFD